MDTYRIDKKQIGLELDFMQKLCNNNKILYQNQKKEKGKKIILLPIEIFIFKGFCSKIQGCAFWLLAAYFWSTLLRQYAGGISNFEIEMQFGISSFRIQVTYIENFDQQMLYQADFSKKENYTQNFFNSRIQILQYMKYFMLLRKKMLQLEIMYEESLFFCRQEHHLLCMLDILLICWAIKK